MLQPYLTPGAGHPQQTYMVSHPGVQQPHVYQIPQPYQQPQGPGYHMALAPQHMQPMQNRSPSMLTPNHHMTGGPMPGAMNASNQHLHSYNMQQVPTANVQKSLYTNSWTAGQTHVRSPPRPSQTPPTAYNQGMCPKLWKPPTPNVPPPSGQMMSLLPSYTSGITQTYSPASSEPALCVSQNGNHGNQVLSSTSHLVPPPPPPFPGQSQSRYQSQNVAIDIKSAYARQRSESGSAASSRSSSPQRSRTSSVHSLCNLATVEAKDDRCTSSPPIAPHPFTTWKSNDSQVVPDAIETEETSDQVSVEEKLFQSRASSHGIQISAPGTFDPAAVNMFNVKKKKPQKAYCEKVKADRFMEIALKRGISVTMADGTQTNSQDSASEHTSLTGEESSANSVSGDGDDKFITTGTEPDSSDNTDAKSYFSDSCSQSDGESYLSDFSSQFARVIIEDVCAKLTQELNSGLTVDNSPSTLNAEAKEFTMKWTTEEPMSLNPESPEFKPSFFRHKEAAESTDEDVSSALFQRHCSSGVDIYIADQPEIEIEADEEEPSQTEFLMVDVAVNTRRIKYKDANMQTPLAFEPRDVCVNTDEVCMREESEFYAPEILRRTQRTNTSQPETKSRAVQVRNGSTKTQSQGVQVGASDFQVKSCKHCPEKVMQIIQLQMQVCHLRAQMCISELQRQMTELQQSKLQITSFFTPHSGDEVQVSNLIGARIEWLEDEITETKVSLMKCLEELQKGRPLETLPFFGITIATSVGNTVLVPKEVKIIKHPETGAGESPPSRKRTHEKDSVPVDCVSPQKTQSLAPTIDRVSTRALVQESLLEMQNLRKPRSASTPNNSTSRPNASLNSDENIEKSLQDLAISVIDENRMKKPTSDYSCGHFDKFTTQCNQAKPVATVTSPTRTVSEALKKLDSNIEKYNSSHDSMWERKDKHSGDDFSSNFKGEFPSLSNDVKPVVKSSMNTLCNNDNSPGSFDQFLTSSSKCSPSESLEQSLQSTAVGSDSLVGMKPAPVENPVSQTIFQPSLTNLETPGTEALQAFSSDSSFGTSTVENLVRQTNRTDLQNVDSTNKSNFPVTSSSLKLGINLSNEMVNSPPESSPPSPISILPFPLPSNDSTYIKRDHGQKSVSMTTSSEASPSLTPVKQEKTDMQHYSNENYSQLAKKDEMVLTDAVNKDPEQVSGTPKKDAEGRAPPGFDKSESPVDDFQCDIDTDQLVKKARAVLQNFNLTSGKSRVIVKSQKIPSSSPASVVSSASGSPQKESSTSPSVEVLTTGKSVAGTGEVVQVVNNNHCDNDTGISQLILSARKTLRESEALSEKIIKEPPTLEQEICARSPASGTPEKLQTSSSSSLQMASPVQAVQSEGEHLQMAAHSDKQQSSLTAITEIQQPLPAPPTDTQQPLPSVITEIQQPLTAAVKEIQQPQIAAPTDTQQPLPASVAEVQQPSPVGPPHPRLQQAGQINPNLYQAVFAQVAKAYPHLASNPMMLHSVCLQQTMVLQSYMKGTQGSEPTPAGAPALPPPVNQHQPPVAPGSGDGQHVQCSAFLPSRANNLSVYPGPHPATAPDGASWNPVTLVNMMQARKGTGDGQQADVTDAGNQNPHSAFKFQAAVPPSSKTNHPAEVVAISGMADDTEKVPSLLKDYVLKDKNPNAPEASTAGGVLVPQQSNSPVKETNPFEPIGGTSRSPFTKVTSQKKRPASKTKPMSGRVSPAQDSQKELFPSVKATKVPMNEDWEDECESYPAQFTCKQDVKAPVCFRPIEPAADEDMPEWSRSVFLPQTSSVTHETRSQSGSLRGRSRNASEKGQSDRSQNSTRSNTPSEDYQTASSTSKTSTLYRSISNSSTDSKPDSRKASYAGLDDFEEFGGKRDAKPNKLDTNFLGRLLKSAITSNDRLKKKEEKVEIKTPDPEKKEEVEDDDWQTVGMKKRKRDQTRAEQLPSMALVPSTSKGPSKTARNNFDKLVEHLEKVFPFLSRTEIKDLVQAVRQQRGGGLTGMKMNDIVDSAKNIIHQKFQTKLLSDSAHKKPVAMITKPTEGMYCTPEFQKHYEITTNALPLRPTVRSPGASSNDEDVCPICFEDFSHNKKQRLDCGHEFHVPCIREWVLKHERTCPTCRRLTLFQEEFPRLK